MALAEEYALPVLAAPDPNDPSLLEQVRAMAPELFILAGYGPILRQEAISIPTRFCINLHGGRLPEYRGSSPMNWALINAEATFGISIIKVSPGVDTGDVLAERQFPIGPNDTIQDLHRLANDAFPEMLLQVLEGVERDTVAPLPQDNAKAAYFPLRFAEDGIIFFDTMTAEQIHNMIRSLTLPYPCAYTYFGTKRVRLIASHLRQDDYFGVAGRIYMKRQGSLLVCARDKCLWIDDARFDDDTQAHDAINRYDRLATLSGTAEAFLLWKAGEEAKD
jgi:methionyl-tRNA formyltransferase